MSWMQFNIKQFLKDSSGWEEKIQSLQEELDNMPELPAVKNSEVHSGNISNPTMQNALRRLKIQSEIEELKLNREMLNYAFKALTEDERRLIDGFFFPKKPKTIFREEYGREHGLNKDYVYAERDRVLEKMRMVIESEYYGEN